MYALIVIDTYFVFLRGWISMIVPRIYTVSLGKVQGSLISTL
jgi:hypothetical protein